MFNFAKKKLEELRKLAGPHGAYVHNFDLDEDEADEDLPFRPVVRPTVSLNSPSAARPQRPVPQVAPSTPQATPFQRQSPITQARDEITAWADQLGKNPTATKLPDLKWISNQQVYPGGSDLTWDVLFHQTVSGSLRRIGWRPGMIQSTILEKIDEAKKSRGFAVPSDEEDGLDKNLGISPSALKNEPHIGAFSNFYNEMSLRNPMFRNMLGLGNESRWGDSKSQAMGDAVFSAFGAPYASRGIRNDVRFFATRENVHYLPSSVRQQIEPYIAALPADRFALDPTKGKQEQAKQATPEYKEVVSILSQPNNLKLIQNRLAAMFEALTPGKSGQAASTDPEAAQMLGSVADKQRFMMAVASRLKQEVSARQKNLERRKKDESNAVSMDAPIGEKGTLGDNAAAPGTGGGNFVMDRANQKVEQQRDLSNKVQEKASEVSSSLIGVSDEVRKLGSDIATFVSKSKPSNRIDPAELREKAIKKLQNAKQPTTPEAVQKAMQEVQALNRGNRDSTFILAEGIRAYSQAVADALRDMMNPNDPKGAKLLEDVAKKMVRRENGAADDGGTLAKPADNPDLDPDRAYSPSNPADADLYKQYTGYADSQSRIDPSRFNRRTMLELVGEQDFIKAVRQHAQKYMNYSGKGVDPATAKPHQFSNEFQSVGNKLDQAMNEKRPKVNMQQSFGDWAVFLTLPEVQKRYSTAARRLFMDIMPMRKEYANGKGALGAAWSAVYHAARGELHRAPGQVGWGGPKATHTTPDAAFSRVKKLQEQARQSAGFSAVNRRWQQLQRAKTQAEQTKQEVMAMNARNLMLKTAQVDTTHIDVMIAHLDAEMERECDLFFHALRA